MARIALALAGVLVLAAAAVAVAGNAFSRTENLASNSSIELDTSYWLNSGTSIAATSRYAKFGKSALAVATVGDRVDEGPALGGPLSGGFMGVDPSTVYTASIWVRGRGTVKPLIEWFNSDSLVVKDSYGRPTKLSDGWQRLVLTARSTSSTKRARLFVITPSRQPIRFFVDGAQVEASSTPTPYHTSALTRSTLLFWGLLAAGFGLALLVFFRELGFPALAAWAPLSVLAYPFLRAPSANPVITFDRLWIGATLGCLVFSLRAVRRSRAAQLLLAALVWLAMSYGLRAATTAGGRQLALVYWLDAIVLPLILFVVVRELARHPYRSRVLIGGLAVAGTLLAVVGLAEAMFGFELATRSGGTVITDATIGRIRISGPYSAPEPYAASLLLCFAATLLWTQLRRRYVLGAAAATLQAAAIGLSFFRVAWLALVLVLFVALKLPRKRLLQLGGGVAVVAVAAVAVSAAGGPSQFTTRLKNLRNVEGRLAAYRQTFEVVRTAPIVNVSDIAR